VGGSKSPPWLRHGVDALAAALPNARHRTLAGQAHLVKAKALAPCSESSSREVGREHAPMRTRALTGRPLNSA
jgi:hypothetical protein